MSAARARRLEALERIACPPRIVVVETRREAAHVGKDGAALVVVTGVPQPQRGAP